MSMTPTPSIQRVNTMPIERQRCGQATAPERISIGFSNIFPKTFGTSRDLRDLAQPNPWPFGPCHQPLRPPLYPMPLLASFVAHLVLQLVCLRSRLTRHIDS